MMSAQEIALERIKYAIENKQSVLDLSGLGLEEIPDELGQLTDLAHLFLAGNQIKNIYDIITSKKLQVIYLDQRQMDNVLFFFYNIKHPDRVLNPDQLKIIDQLKISINIMLQFKTKLVARLPPELADLFAALCEAIDVTSLLVQKLTPNTLPWGPYSSEPELAWPQSVLLLNDLKDTFTDIFIQRIANPEAEELIRELTVTIEDLMRILAQGQLEDLADPVARFRHLFFDLKVYLVRACTDVWYDVRNSPIIQEILRTPLIKNEFGWIKPELFKSLGNLISMIQNNNPDEGPEIAQNLSILFNILFVDVLLSYEFGNKYTCIVLRIGDWMIPAIVPTSSPLIVPPPKVI